MTSLEASAFSNRPNPEQKAPEINAIISSPAASTEKPAQPKSSAGSFLPQVTLVSTPEHDKFIDSMAHTIRQATRRDNFIDTGTDEKTILTTLQDLSESDREQLSKLYKSKYNISLRDEIRRELSGADLSKAEGFLDKKDTSSGESVQFRALFQEANQWVIGRSKGNIAGVICDKLSTLSATDIAKIDGEYRQQYGKGFAEALTEDGDFDKYTREMLPILLKGADKISTQDHLQMAEIALRKGDAEMFQRVMANASPEARQKFVRSGGQERVQKTFEGHWYHAMTFGLSGDVSDQSLRHAKDYMNMGHLSASNKLRDNSSLIGDNENAIEDALKNMSAEERQSYTSARQSILRGEKPAIADRIIYSELQERMKDAGNQTERAAWEALILYPESKIAKELLDHNKIIDSSTTKIISSIEHMSKDDWYALKHNPQFRKDMEAILKPFLSDSQMQRAVHAFDKLQNCQTYDEVQVRGHRSIEHSIADNIGIFSNDKFAIVDALTKMSPEEIQRYRTDSKFRSDLDIKVSGALGFGAAGEVGKAVLQRLLNNESPALNVIDKINMASTKLNVNEAKVIADLQMAFRENPDLVRVVNHPKEKKETKFASDLNTALRRALDLDEYKKYALPVLKTGKLDVATQNELSNSWWHTDKKTLLDNISTVDSGERAMLLSTDKSDKAALELQDRVFGALNPDLRHLAKVVLEQRALGPEDRIRSFVLGAGTSKEETLEQLGKMTSEQKAEIFQRYATKYGGSLTADIMQKLKSQDRDLGEIVARNRALSADEQLNIVLDNHSHSRQGVGKYFIDNMWDGTGFQSDEARHLMVQAMRNAQIAGTDLSPENAMKYARRSTETLNLYRDSKAKFGEVATDVGITALAIGGAFFTGGTSLSLLAKVGIAGSIGAVVKVGGKSLVSGSDYDWSTRQVALDGGVGFIYGSTAFLGSHALAKTFGVGSTAGTHAAELAQASIARMAQSGGSSMVAEGSEAIIRDGMTSIVRNMLLRGGNQVPAEALTALASQVATQGNENAVRLALQVSLAQSMKQQAMSTGTKLAIEYGFPTAAGALSGGSAGTVRGAAEWDSDRPLDENLANVGKHAATSAAIGAGSAFIFKLGTKAVAVGYDALTANSAGGDQMLNNPETYINDRADDVGIFKKKPVVLKAVQAKEATTIQTLEGPVQANKGDWIMTGVKGENWPVRPDVFARSYDPVAGARDMYQKKPISIMAVQIDRAMNILDANGAVKYQGSPGDWLVVGLNGDKYFVKPDVFSATYGAVDDIAQRTLSTAENALRAATATAGKDVTAAAIARADDFLKQKAGDLAPFRKAPVELKAVQAREPQIIDTWEGPIKAEPGDWIMTGVKGERWPLKPDMFKKMYESTDTPGVFRKRPVTVQAVQIEQAMQIFEDGQLKFTGKPTDWLVVNVDGKPYFVDNEVFKQTFNAIKGS